MIDNHEKVGSQPRTGARIDGYKPMSIYAEIRTPSERGRRKHNELDRSLLIVEDDTSFLQRLARAMEGCGFAVTTAETVTEGLVQVERAPPAFALVDMRLPDGNGLDVVSAIKKRRPAARAIILTGYANIATAVTAVKLGAVDYLAKPVDADDVVAALLALDNKEFRPPQNTMSIARVRWEHIQRIYELHGCNVSETARRLNTHRRTLQRILARRMPK